MNGAFIVNYIYTYFFIIKIITEMVCNLPRLTVDLYQIEPNHTYLIILKKIH